MAAHGHFGIPLSDIPWRTIGALDFRHRLPVIANSSL
jgi:hypothetical protein